MSPDPSGLEAAWRHSDATPDRGSTCEGCGSPGANYDRRTGLYLCRSCRRKTTLGRYRR